MLDQSLSEGRNVPQHATMSRFIRQTCMNIRASGRKKAGSMSGGLAVSGGIRQGLRFGAVSALGTALDLALAYGLVTLVSVPIVLAASVGFAAGSVVNYIGHSVFSVQGENVRRASVQG